MYAELLEAISSDEMLHALLMNDVLKSLRLYSEELMFSNNYHIIYRFEDVFSKWIHVPAKTIYHNPQNVHVFMTPAAQAASEIMNKYPCVYEGRPFDHPFFNVIETEELVNGIHMPSLFASIWLYVTTHEEREAMTKRLLEEMNESEDMCLSGHMARMVNSVKGFGNESFDFNLEQYEYNKANIFNQLNKLLDLTVIDNLLDRMEGVVNKVNVRDIDDEHVLRILRDYSKREWTRTDGILLYMR